MIQNLQEFLQEFVTNPGEGDNRFLFQPVFRKKNFGLKGRKSKLLLPEFYGSALDLKICVIELYVMNKFINFKKFKLAIREKWHELIMDLVSVLSSTNAYLIESSSA